METFSALMAICAGNSPVTGEFPAQRPVTRSFDVFFHLRLNKRLSKQSWGWWFETPSRPLWRHCNELIFTDILCSTMGISWSKNEYDMAFCSIFVGSELKYLVMCHGIWYTPRIIQMSCHGLCLVLPWCSGPITIRFQLEYQHGHLITSPFKCGVKLLIHSQTSTVISFFTL